MARQEEAVLAVFLRLTLRCYVHCSYWGLSRHFHLRKSLLLCQSGTQVKLTVSSPMQQHGLVASHQVSNIHLPPSVTTGLHSPTQSFPYGLSQIPTNCPYFFTEFVWLERKELEMHEKATWPSWPAKAESCSAFQGVCAPSQGRATPALTWVIVNCHETHPRSSTTKENIYTHGAQGLQYPTAKKCCLITAVKINLISCNSICGESHLKAGSGLCYTGMFQ